MLTDWLVTGRILRRHKGRTTGTRRPPLIACLILIVMSVFAIFAPVLSPSKPSKIDLVNALAPPLQHGLCYTCSPLGTDNLGRDIFSRLIYGARVSLTISLAAIAMSGSIGTLLGLVSGYFGGLVDALIMRITDLMLSMPLILLAVALAGVLGPSLQNVVLILGLTNWTGYARLVRGQVLSIREREHVRMAKVIGCNSARIVFIHILPYVGSSLIVYVTLDTGKVIMLEAILSFLGLGVQWPNSSWGLMVSDGRQYMASAWWLVTMPGLAITVTILSMNILGDYLRDVLQPGGSTGMGARP